MLINKEKVKEWIHDRCEDIRTWWLWNKDIVLVTFVFFALVFIGFLMYAIECYKDRKYDYEIHYAHDCHLRCNEDEIVRDGHVLIVKRDNKTYILTNYEIIDNRTTK